jgi:hypothetical protein
VEEDKVVKSRTAREMELLGKGKVDVANKLAEAAAAR